MTIVYDDTDGQTTGDVPFAPTPCLDPRGRTRSNIGTALVRD